MYSFHEIISKPFSTIIILLSFIVSICSLGLGMCLFNGDFHYYFKSKKFVENTNAVYIETKAKTVDDIISYLENIDSSYEYVLGDSYEYQYKNQKILVYGVKNYYKLNELINIEEGRSFSKHELNYNEDVAIIGDQLSYLTYVKNNKKYIKIDAKEFEVIGVFDKKIKTKFCYSIFIPIKAIPYKLRTKNIADNIIFFNKKYNINNIIAKLQLNNKEMRFSKYIDEGLSFKNIAKKAYIQNKREIKSISFSLLISLVNIFIFSFIWSKDIEKNLIIKLMIGASRKDIIKLLLIQLLVIALISDFIAFIICYFTINSLADFVGIQLISNSSVYITSIIATIMMVFTCLFVILANISKCNLGEYMR